MSLRLGSNLFEGREPLINYDFIDIADGTGYVTYYGAGANGGSYITTPNSNTQSEYIKTITEGQSVATTLTKYFDIDFDITFSTPKNIKGDILINVPIGIAAASTTGEDFSWQVKTSAYHYDGTTETQMGSEATSPIYTINNLQSDVELVARMSNNALLKISQTSVQHFKAGEILRITVEGWFRTDEGGATTADIGIAHDPSNRDDYDEEPDEPATNSKRQQIIVTGQPTRLSIQVPFKLDI